MAVTYIKTKCFGARLNLVQILPPPLPYCVTSVELHSFSDHLFVNLEIIPILYEEGDLMPLYIYIKIIYRYDYCRKSRVLEAYCLPFLVPPLSHLLFLFYTRQLTLCFTL